MDFSFLCLIHQRTPFVPLALFDACPLDDILLISQTSAISYNKQNMVLQFF